MDSRTALELTKIKMQIEILQTLVLRHDVMLPVFAGAQSLVESRQRTLTVLEGAADIAERHYFSDPNLPVFDETERALYADEYREIVEKMKAYVNSVGK